MRWTELEQQSRRLVDQLRSELHDVEPVMLERSEAAEMAAKILDRAALRELREDDPGFVRKVAREDGLESVRQEQGDDAFEEVLHVSVLDRMCGVMLDHLAKRRGTPRRRREFRRYDTHAPAS